MPLGVLIMMLRQPKNLEYGGLTTGEMECMEALDV
jgi:hypothetical protein